MAIEYARQRAEAKRVKAERQERIKNLAALISGARTHPSVWLLAC